MILGRRPAEPNRGVFVCTMDLQSFLSADGSQVVLTFTSSVLYCFCIVLLSNSRAGSALGLPWVCLLRMIHKALQCIPPPVSYSPVPLAAA